MRLINAAGVTTLGEVATITAPEVHAEHDEPDRFSWSDAARWQPEAGETDEPALHPELSDEELDTLFGEDADAEVGTAYELGWFGIVRWPERQGGVILARDSLGRRHIWVVSSDAVLDQRWQEIQQDYEAFYTQRDAYEQVTQEPEGSPSGLNPRVWVGSLADYNDGVLHGAWFDATREPAELELVTRYMLRTGENRGAEEWAAMDYDDFAGAQLGEHSSFEVVSRVARGIAEHGEAFGDWAAYVGSEDLGQLGSSEDHYRGEWESFEAYIDDYLQETEFYAFMESVPEEMRGYVEVDVVAIAQDWSGEYLVVELRDGRVAVIDTTE